MEAHLEAVSAAASSIVSLVLTYPLNVISNRIQVTGTGRRRSSSATSEDATHLDPSQGVTEVVEEEDVKEPVLKSLRLFLERRGFKSLYVGMSSAVVSSVVSNYAYNFAYARFKNIFARHGLRDASTKQLKLLHTVVIPVCSGVVMTLVTLPIWVINLRMVTKRSQMLLEDNEDGDSGKPTKKKMEINTINIVREILQKHGILGFFRGLGPSLVLVSIPMIHFFVFENLCNAFKRRQVRITAKHVFILTLIAKAVATTITYPYLVARSRLQADQADNSHGVEYTGAWAVIGRLLREGGPGLLYKGLTVKLVQGALNSAILYATKHAMVEAISGWARSRKVKTLRA